MLNQKQNFGQQQHEYTKFNKDFWLIKLKLTILILLVKFKKK